MLTSIGDDNLLMAYVHVAHDCAVGSHTVIGHAATLGGHVTVGDWAIVGAGSGVHQFCRVGRARDHRRLQRDHAGRAAVFQHRDRRAK